MPTLQVTPDALDLLQDVADALAKSRKMVIITGAGISTNSGIPDFRSENGLYSLIQAQFERAEASATPNLKKDLAAETHDETAAVTADATATSLDIHERPLKRRRTSGPNSAASSPTLLPDSIPTPNRPISPNPTGTQTPPSNDTNHNPLPEQPGPISEEPATTAPALAAALPDSPRRVTRSRANILRPTIPRHLTQNSADSSTSHDSVFSDPPPSCDSSQTDVSVFLDTSVGVSSHTRSSTSRHRAAHLSSSSPLSSPPPDLFDPYETANSSTDNCSHEGSDCSETPGSDDTQQSSDFFSSQASNSNLRNMKGRDLFDCNIWADPLKTSVFYRFATSLRQRVKDVEPTTTHRFIAQMRDVGKLARVYTQNIDEIEKKIGLSTDLKHGCGTKKRRSLKPQVVAPLEKEEATETSFDDLTVAGSTDTQPSQRSLDDPVPAQPKARHQTSPDRGVECVFLHGSLHSLRCFVCGKLSDWDEDGRESCTLSGEQPECPHCAGATAARQEKGKRALGIGKLRPDIVLYGEEHPQSDLISPIVQHDLATSPDLLLVLGTSLRVHGLKVMVKEFAKAVHKKGGKVVFINFTKPSESAWGDVLDYWIQWDCDAWVEDLKTRKPLLWLSPDERLELDKQKREALAEKKREALKKRESIVEKKRDSLGDKKPVLIEPIKTRPPPKNPVAMRNDYQCAAYVVWDIFQTLAKIGDRPFDNLGYAPPTYRLLEPAILPNVEHRDTPDVSAQKPPKPQKRNRKPLPEKAPSRGPDSRIVPVSLGPSSNSILKLDSLPSGTIATPAPVDPEPQQPPTLSPCADKPRAKTRKPRKYVPKSRASKGVEHKPKPAIEKRNESHTGKDRYLQAVKELARSRKSATPGCSSALPNQPPATPVHPQASKPPDLDLCPIFDPRCFTEKDPGSARHIAAPYTPYSLQPWLLPPLPTPPTPHYGSPSRSVPVQGREYAQRPVLPPLPDNWEPPPKLAPMEIALLVGPASPLAENRGSGLRRSGSMSKNNYPYAWHHSTKPIYNDALVGISSQGTTAAQHKVQQHQQHQQQLVDCSEDKTPSPSDQLRMEAASQLWQLSGRAAS
ncbi:hypothetical protein F4802DRAFT_620856 [Xylaria palmicola]|nr:hypothetical protein F4802DRAFT_620856 [Xylaria palmicola]